MKKNKGFSLVELIVTIAVLGILTTGVIMVTGTNNGWKVNQAAELLDSALNKASVSAMSKGGVKGLIVYELDETYYASIISESCKSGGAYCVTGDKIVQKIKLGHTPVSIGFTYVGTDGATVAPVTLVNQSDETNLTSAAEFLFDRSTGAIKKVTVGAVDSYYTGAFVTCGSREKDLVIYAATGKHEIQ